MQTECSAGAYEFPASCGRRVVARFDGGRMSSDGGAILVKQADDILGLSRRFAACFRDERGSVAQFQRLDVLQPLRCFLTRQSA